MPELISKPKQESDADESLTSPGSIFDDVESKLRATSDDDTLTLWADIRAAFDEGGPNEVKAVIEDRVKHSILAAEKDLKRVRSVTKSAAPKKKAPIKKAAASKRAVKK
ncbi:MAG: hypothetical protein ACYDB2_07555 [Acidimicrobiales bacterium]